MSSAAPIQGEDRELRVGATPLSRTMVPNAFGAIWCDAASGTYKADPPACAAFGVPAEGPYADAWLQDLLARITPDPGGPQRYYTFHDRRGSVARARLVTAHGPVAVILVDDLRDITDRVFRLKAKELEYRELLEHSPCGIFRATCEGQLIHANPALVRLQGYATEAEMLDAMGQGSHQDYCDPDRQGSFLAELARNGRVVDFVSEVRRHATGEAIRISETAWLVRDEAGSPRYMAGTVSEITERMRHLERMKAAAETDSLTGLANRAAFHAAIERRIAAAEPAGFDLFLIDCDRFKDVNDVYGHARGDAVLRVCAARLRQALPADCLVARLGGDEFAVLAPGGARVDLDAMSRRILDQFTVPIELGGASHVLGASIGIARCPEHAASATGLLRNADLALYSVKENGRGHARLFDVEFERAKQCRHALERDMRGAEVRGELELHYQPVVDGRSGAPLGLEALLRWHHPQRGLLAPGEFIAVAEDSGLVIPFGDWSIREACRHAAALPTHLTVAVNVSALQFRSGDLPRVVATALASAGLTAARLELEVTEATVLQNEKAALRILQQLKALGVGITLDDFGTGYSTLSYLPRFAFDKVKIDRTFIRSLRSNAVNRAVTRAMLSIGRDLGLVVVAEGIETEAERQVLLDEGCHLMQGFHFGRPEPFAAIAGRLAAATLRTAVPRPADPDPQPAARTGMVAGQLPA